MLECETPMIAQRDPKFFTNFFYVLHQFLAALFGEVRNRYANNLAVVVGRQTEIRLENGFLYISHRAPVIRLNDQETGLGSAQSRDLIQRGRRAVIFNDDMLQKSGRCPSSPEFSQLFTQRPYGVVHLFLQLSENSFVHRFPPLTKVPIGSPETTLLILPFSMILKTMIGNRLSMQSDIAV